MSRDVFADIAAILHPLPQPPDGIDAEGFDDDGYDAWRRDAAEEQQRTAEHLRLSWEEGELDPLLAALAAARQRKEQAEADIRQLIAYGREFVLPRPYTLGDLAAAAGMSVSGTRTAYGHRDVAAVADATGAKPREWRNPDDEQVRP